MFYHLTNKDLGQVFEFTPQIPESALIEVEGNIPRICVSKSIQGCINGVCGGKNPSYTDILTCFSSCDFYTSEDFKKPQSVLIVVYGSEEAPYLPPAISDFRENEEYWFLKPTTFKRLGYLDFESLKNKEIVISNMSNTKLFENLAAISKEETE